MNTSLTNPDAATPCLRVVTRLAWSVCLALLPMCSAQAESASGEFSALFDVPAMLARLERIQSDPAELAAAVERGRGLAARCAYCHGADGNSDHREVPTLASQSVVYLVKETAAYGNGTRKDYVMSKMVPRFGVDEIVDLSVFYAGRPFKRVATGDPKLARVGEPLYEGMCRDCHGADGRGERGYAWIAGQRVAYVEEALRRYRKGRGKRMDEQMSAVSKNLSDSNIKALAAYIANMD
jgi:cytochrome c553